MGQISVITDAVVDGNIGETKEAVRKVLDDGAKPMEIIDDGLIAGLDIIGDKFAKGEVFLPEMMLSALAAEGGIQIATSGMKAGEFKPKATIVLGTVKGDLHDIGKNIVSTVLKSRGFEVIDLGTDVQAEEIVDAVKDKKPDFLGLSALLTSTMQEMAVVIDALAAGGVRDSVKVIVGGAPINEEFATKIGADYYGGDAGSSAVVLEEAIK